MAASRWGRGCCTPLTACPAATHTPYNAPHPHRLFTQCWGPSITDLVAKSLASPPDESKAAAAPSALPSPAVQPSNQTTGPHPGANVLLLGDWPAEWLLGAQKYRCVVHFAAPHNCSHAEETYSNWRTDFRRPGILPSGGKLYDYLSHTCLELDAANAAHWCRTCACGPHMLTCTAGRSPLPAPCTNSSAAQALLAARWSSKYRVAALGGEGGCRAGPDSEPGWLG